MAADDRDWLDFQLDTALSATAAAVPIGPGGVPWRPAAVQTSSLDGGAFEDGDEEGGEAALDVGHAGSNGSDKATLVDSAATSVVGEGDAAPRPPPAGRAAEEQRRLLRTPASADQRPEIRQEKRPRPHKSQEKEETETWRWALRHPCSGILTTS